MAETLYTPETSGDGWTIFLLKEDGTQAHFARILNATIRHQPHLTSLGDYHQGRWTGAVWTTTHEPTARRLKSLGARVIDGHPPAPAEGQGWHEVTIARTDIITFAINAGSTTDATSRYLTDGTEVARTTNTRILSVTPQPDPDRPGDNG